MYHITFQKEYLWLWVWVHEWDTGVLPCVCVPGVCTHVWNVLSVCIGAVCQVTMEATVWMHACWTHVNRHPAAYASLSANMVIPVSVDTTTTGSTASTGSYRFPSPSLCTLQSDPLSILACLILNGWYKNLHFLLHIMLLRYTFKSSEDSSMILDIASKIHFPITALAIMFCSLLKFGSLL